MLTRNTWAQGCDAIDHLGNTVSWDSPNAVRRDLTSSLRVMYSDDKELVSQAIYRIKSVLNIDPVLSGVVPDKSEYEDEFGKLFESGNEIWPYIPLYMFNDKMSWEEMQRLLILVDFS